MHLPTAITVSQIQVTATLLINLPLRKEATEQVVKLAIHPLVAPSDFLALLDSNENIRASNYQRALQDCQYRQ